MNYGYARPDPKEPWQLPTSDPACIAVREELKKVMKYWLELGADGFRVDLAASLIRNDLDHQGIGALWHYYRSWLDKEYPEAALISEWSDQWVSRRVSRLLMTYFSFQKSLPGHSFWFQSDLPADGAWKTVIDEESGERSPEKVHKECIWRLRALCRYNSLPG